MRLLRPLLLTTLALALLTFGAVPPQADQHLGYQVIDLGTLGGERSEANAINNRGQVVGWAETGAVDEEGEPIRHAFLWDQQHGMRDLGTLGGARSEARDINDRGQVVGWAALGRGRLPSDSRAFLWSRGAGLIAVPGAFPSWGDPINGTDASAINNRGQIVGYARAHGGAYLKAVLWQEGRAVWLPHGFHGTAQGINDRGEVAGWGMLGDPEYHAHLWTPPNYRQNYVIRRSEECYDYGRCHDRAHAINNRGQIVGESERGPFLVHGRRVTWLGLLPGRAEGAAWAINERTQVVGTCWNQWAVDDYVRTDKRPFLWQRGHLTDLNDQIGFSPGWRLRDARDINDRGQIVGHGEQFGIRRAFLLNPRP